jgi:DNA-binding MarR family transcriptional regulator
MHDSTSTVLSKYVPRTHSSPSGPAGNVGFLLAKASQHFNELLVERFAVHGFPEMRASYGSVLVPLFERDGLRLGELAAAARLSKQAMTGLVRRCEDGGLVERERDPLDGRAFNVRLTARGRDLRVVAADVLSELDDELVRALGKRNSEALVRALKGVMEL